MIDKIISSGISTVMWGEENHVTGRCHVTCSERSLPAVAATSTPQLDEDADWRGERSPRFSFSCPGWSLFSWFGRSGLFPGCATVADPNTWRLHKWPWLVSKVFSTPFTKTRVFRCSSGWGLRELELEPWKTNFELETFFRINLAQLRQSLARLPVGVTCCFDSSSHRCSLRPLVERKILLVAAASNAALGQQGCQSGQYGGLGGGRVVRVVWVSAGRPDPPSLFSNMKPPEYVLVSSRWNLLNPYY